MDFKPGDVVRLKSDGPLMTINSIDPNSKGISVAYCEWFNQEGHAYELKHAHFSVHTLEKTT